MGQDRGEQNRFQNSMHSRMASFPTDIHLDGKGAGIKVGRDNGEGNGILWAVYLLVQPFEAPNLIRVLPGPSWGFHETGTQSFAHLMIPFRCLKRPTLLFSFSHPDRIDRVVGRRIFFHGYSPSGLDLQEQLRHWPTVPSPRELAPSLHTRPDPYTQAFVDRPFDPNEPREVLVRTPGARRGEASRTTISGPRHAQKSMRLTGGESA